MRFIMFLSTLTPSTINFLLLYIFLISTSSTEIYTLPLHDALPIWAVVDDDHVELHRLGDPREGEPDVGIAKAIDRKSTRLNSSHRCISYAVFCLKKKKKNKMITYI